MNQQKSDSEQVAKSVAELVQYYFSTSVQKKLKTSIIACSLEPLTIEKTWTIQARVQKKTLIGRHGSNQFGTFRACEEALNTDIEKIESGAVAEFVEALLRFIAEDPLKCLWKNAYHLEDYGNYLYVRHCNQCAGYGQQTCSSCSGKGSKLCYNCAGSRRMTCVDGCSGSGHIGYGEFRKVCGGCGGSGSARCTGCFGAGERQCDGCSGRGRNPCDPCNATGYFTKQYWLDVFGHGAEHIEHRSDLPDWQSDYLDKALNHSSTYPPLSDVCTLDSSSLLRRGANYPIKFKVQGEVKFTEATLELHDTISQGTFVGLRCQAYKLDQFGDAIFKPIANNLDATESAKNLRGTLTLAASEQLLANRKNAEASHSTHLLEANIISPETANTFIRRFEQLTDSLKRKRSSIPIGNWLRNSAFYTLIALGLAAIFDSASGNSLVWDQAGLYAVVNHWNFFGALVDFTYFHWFAGLPYTYGVTAAGILAIHIIGRQFLSSRRKFNTLGALVALLLTNCLVFLALVMLQPAIATLAESSLVVPDLPSLATGLMGSLMLLPEALLLGTLIAMLRLRSRNDSRLFSFAKEIGSAPLLNELGYE